MADDDRPPTRKKPRAAPARKAARPKPTPVAAGTGTWRDTAAVRVRMYRHGLGDCFLLTFPTPGGADFQVLIDCGVILGTPKGAERIRRVVEDLRSETSVAGVPTLDVLVATHEHWDHLSGFVDARAEFDQFAIKAVWMAWTEDPTDPQAKAYRAVRAKKVQALRSGVAHLKARLVEAEALGADGQSGSAGAEFRRVAAVLSFFGIDPDEPLGPADPDGVGAAAAAKLGVADAMDWCRDRVAAPAFLSPGAVVEPAGVAGLKVYVLGPPRDRRHLLKSLPTARGREAYELDGAGDLGAARAFLGLDPATPGANATRAALAQGAPFDRKYRIEVAAAAKTDFFRDHYFGTGPADADAGGWRRIDGTGLAEASAFALRLDGDTNNTSLALAFELPDGRVLLFPGDAQVGNWESWHADPDDMPRVFEAGGRKVTAKELLAHTAVYKVGHHGSHNATLRALGLELMPKGEFVALVPVDTYVAHEKKGWDKMPFEPLLAALHAQTGGRVIVADQPLSALPAGTFAPGEAQDSGDTIDDPEDPAVKRPLFVDYFLPAAPRKRHAAPH